MVKATDRLALGKIPIGILDSTVLSLTGHPSDQVVALPRAGVDFAAVRAGGKFLIVSADPITGVSDDIGTYAVRVSANDVATSGNRPQFAESVVLLPEGAGRGDLERISLQIHGAAKASRISVVGGHTEVTPGLKSPIVVITAFAFADRFVTSEGARDGDTILMTKTAGLEGTAELARARATPPGSVPQSSLKRASRFIHRIDVTEEAVAAFGTGAVHAMHDCTEGGVLGAVYEMSTASRMGFQLIERAIPVAPETRAICDALSIDPIKLIGSGSLLMAVEGGKEDEVSDALKPLTRVARIGRFRKGPKTLVKRGGTRRVAEAPADELWRVLAGALARKRLKPLLSLQVPPWGRLQDP